MSAQKYTDPVTIRAKADLTNSYVAATDLENKHKYNQLILLFDYDQDTTTSFEFKIEYSHDDSTYFQEVSGSITAGTDTLSPLEHTLDTAGTWAYPLAIKARHIRVSVKATGTVAAGTDQLGVQAILGVA